MHYIDDIATDNALPLPCDVFPLATHVTLPMFMLFLELRKPQRIRLLLSVKIAPVISKRQGQQIIRSAFGNLCRKWGE